MIELDLNPRFPNSHIHVPLAKGLCCVCWGDTPSPGLEGRMKSPSLGPWNSASPGTRFGAIHSGPHCHGHRRRARRPPQDSHGLLGSRHSFPWESMGLSVSWREWEHFPQGQGKGVAAGKAPGPVQRRLRQRPRVWPGEPELGVSPADSPKRNPAQQTSSWRAGNPLLFKCFFFFF